MSSKDFKRKALSDEQLKNVTGGTDLSTNLLSIAKDYEDGIISDGKLYDGLSDDDQKKLFSYLFLELGFEVPDPPCIKPLSILRHQQIHNSIKLKWHLIL